MKHKLGLLFAISIGSFALHCTSASRPDASADSGACCSLTPQTFTTIAQGDVMVTESNLFPTPPVDVSQYRELVVGAAITSGNCFLSGGTIGFQEPSTTVFISNQQLGRVRVDGPTVKIVIQTGNGPTCSGTAHYVIAGVT